MSHAVEQIRAEHRYLVDDDRRKLLVELRVARPAPFLSHLFGRHVDAEAEEPVYRLPAHVERRDAGRSEDDRSPSGVGAEVVEQRRFARSGLSGNEEIPFACFDKLERADELGVEFDLRPVTAPDDPQASVPRHPLRVAESLRHVRGRRKPPAFDRAGQTRVQNRVDVVSGAFPAPDRDLAAAFDVAHQSAATRCASDPAFVEGDETERIGGSCVLLCVHGRASSMAERHALPPASSRRLITRSPEYAVNPRSRVIHSQPCSIASAA